ncbi:MAG TPA: YfaZ family outer membrane protein [Gammaproteobacteria bacterium]
MQRPRIILFFMAFFLPFGASAENLDFNLSGDAFLLRFTNAPTRGGAQVDYGLLHQEDDVYIGSLGLHLVDNAGTETSPFQVGLGGRLQFIDTDLASGGLIAVGAWGRYTFPTANRFALAGNIHVAPSVTSFGDVEKYLEFGLRAEYEVLRNGSLYLGYRDIEADFDIAEDVELDDGLHVGMRFTF